MKLNPCMHTPTIEEREEEEDTEQAMVSDTEVENVEVYWDPVHVSKETKGS